MILLKNKKFIDSFTERFEIILYTLKEKLQKHPPKSTISYFFMRITFFRDLLIILGGFYENLKKLVEYTAHNSPFHRISSARWRKWKVFKFSKLFF